MSSVGHPRQNLSPAVGQCGTQFVIRWQIPSCQIVEVHLPLPVRKGLCPAGGRDRRPVVTRPKRMNVTVLHPAEPRVVRIETDNRLFHIHFVGKRSRPNRSFIDPHRSLCRKPDHRTLSRSRGPVDAGGQITEPDRIQQPPQLLLPVRHGVVQIRIQSQPFGPHGQIKSPRFRQSDERPLPGNLSRPVATLQLTEFPQLSVLRIKRHTTAQLSDLVRETRELQRSVGNLRINLQVSLLPASRRFLSDPACQSHAGKEAPAPDENDCPAQSLQHASRNVTQQPAPD